MNTSSTRAEENVSPERIKRVESNEITLIRWILLLQIKQKKDHCTSNDGVIPTDTIDRDIMLNGNANGSIGIL